MATVTITIDDVPPGVVFGMTPTFDELSNLLNGRGLSGAQSLARYAVSVLPEPLSQQLARAPRARDDARHRIVIRDRPDGSAELELRPSLAIPDAQRGFTLAQACVARIWRFLRQQHHNERPASRLILPPGLSS